MLAQLNYWAALPEIIILASASLILLIDLFIPDDRRHISYWLTQLALLLAAGVTIVTRNPEVIHGYHGLIVDDRLADVLRVACFLSVSLMLFYSRAYLAARNLFLQGRRKRSRDGRATVTLPASGHTRIRAT